MSSAAGAAIRPAHAHPALPTRKPFQRLEAPPAASPRTSPRLASPRLANELRAGQWHWLQAGRMKGATSSSRLTGHTRVHMQPTVGEPRFRMNSRSLLMPVRAGDFMSAAAELDFR